MQVTGLESADDAAPLNRSFAVVGIGASAGGIEALSALLRHLPRDSGMAFVVIQHLDPTHASQSPEVLSRASSLPILEAKHGMKLEPNSVFVMPSKVVMTLMDGHIRLTRRSPTGISMPVDAFFGSLAQHHQSRAVGIVLSGNGVDGTQGDWKRSKGKAVSHSHRMKRRRSFFGMPGSAIAAGVVDFVLSPALMATQLKRIAGSWGARKISKSASDGEAAKVDWEKLFESQHKRPGKSVRLIAGADGGGFFTLQAYHAAPADRPENRVAQAGGFDRVSGAIAEQCVRN